MKYNKEQIGNIIKNERKNRGLSQNELGELIFVSGKQVSQYEKGLFFHHCLFSVIFVMSLNVNSATF